MPHRSYFRTARVTTSVPTIVINSTMLGGTGNVTSGYSEITVRLAAGATNVQCSVFQNNTTNAADEVVRLKALANGADETAIPIRTTGVVKTTKTITSGVIFVYSG